MWSSMKIKVSEGVLYSVGCLHSCLPTNSEFIQVLGGHTLQRNMDGSWFVSASWDQSVLSERDVLRSGPKVQF